MSSLAAGAGYVPDYPGADRYSTRAAVLPVFTYRGPVLRIDGGSVSGRLARSSEWELDLSANGAFNANKIRDRNTHVREEHLTEMSIGCHVGNGAYLYARSIHRHYYLRDPCVGRALRARSTY